MIVADANVLIAFFNTNDKFHPPAKAIFQHAAANGINIGISPFTLAEFYVGPIRSGKIDSARKQLHQLQIEPVPLEPGFELQLAHLRASTQLKMPDACVLLSGLQATAKLGNPVLVATFDHKLARSAHSLTAPLPVLDERFTGAP